MKKSLCISVVLLTLILVFGVSWGKLFKRGYTQDEYGVELANRDQRIENWKILSG